MTRQEIRCINDLEVEWNPREGDGIDDGCELGPLPDWLSRLVNRVLADFQKPTPVDIELRYAKVGEWSEQFFPESVGAWGEARPECPGHPHPAEATELAGEPWWICPADGHRIGVIGRLGFDDRSVS